MVALGVDLGVGHSHAQVAPTQIQPAQVTYEQRNGVQYQVTRRVVKRQVPVTVMQNRSQTVYKQQVKSQTISRQQTFCVPVTEYKKISKLHGRWNPFVTPYRTEELKPVTVWKQQVVTVQVPASQLVTVPETKTVQVPVTTYRTVEEEVITRVAMSGSPTVVNSRPSTAKQFPSGPSATLAALPNYKPPTSSSVPPGMGPMGGVASRNATSRRGKGWQTVGQGQSRY
jgi:hypothetical protein